MSNATTTRTDAMETHVTARDGELTVSGGQLASEAPIRTEPGPWGPAVQGFEADEAIDVNLDRPIGNRGTLMLWFRLRGPLVSGKDAEGGGGPIVELGEEASLAALNLWWYTGYAGVAFLLAKSAPGVGGVEVPGLPGPQWFHMAFTWDAEAGFFQGYIDGTPIRVPGSQFLTWESPEAQTLKLHAYQWNIGEVRVLDRPVSRNEVIAHVPSVYRGGLDHTIGAQPLGELDPAAHRGEKLLDLPLTSESEVESWHMEGPGEVSFPEGAMRMRSLTPETEGKQGHILHWRDQHLRPDLLL